MIIVFSCVEKLEKIATTMIQTNKRNVEIPAMVEKSISNRTIYYSFMLSIFLWMNVRLCVLARAHSKLSNDKPTIQQKEKLSREWCVQIGLRRSKKRQMHFQLNLHEALHKKEENGLSLDSKRKTDGQIDEKSF